jgi:hypothetical protein
MRHETKKFGHTSLDPPLGRELQQEEVPGLFRPRRPASGQLRCTPPSRPPNMDQKEALWDISSRYQVREGCRVKTL